MTFQRISLFCLGLSAVAIAVSGFLLFNPGPKFSIEFTGGTLMELELPAGKTKEDLSKVVATYEPKDGEELGNYAVSAVRSVGGGSSFIIRMRPIENEDHVALLAHVEQTFPGAKELHFNTIGPSVSQSLKNKTFTAIGMASVAIITYLAFSFRKLPRKLNPWKFGFLAVVAFLHDVVVTAGVFVVIGQFTSFEFDTLFVTALLTILAYSTSDTIVIFDRIRANLGYENRSESFAQTATRGLKESVARTMGTGISTLIMLTALFFLGAESIRWFILALIFGIVIGTYSSYFVASALLIRWK
ncbi:MAG: protein translocase subunit SecF [Candidatus Peribacteraceae bacterium]|jgi:preprotein translocase SecF subunit